MSKIEAVKGTIVGTLNTAEVMSKEGLKEGDVLIDEQNLAMLANEFNELANDVRNLRKEVQEMLEELKNGFDTPAGRKFYNSCASGLLTPLDQQATVMDHIAENINTAKNMYQPVFEEYREIVNFMNQ